MEFFQVRINRFPRRGGPPASILIPTLGFPVMGKKHHIFLLYPKQKPFNYFPVIWVIVCNDQGEGHHAGEYGVPVQVGLGRVFVPAPLFLMLQILIVDAPDYCQVARDAV